MDGNSANSNSNDSDVEVKEKENKSRESHSTSSNPDITRTTIAVPAPAPAPAASASAVETEEKERARKNVVHIGTRRSELARRQTAIVEEALREAWRGHGHAHGHGHEETGAGVKEAAPATSTEASSSSSSSSSPPPHLLDKTRDIEFIVHAMSTAGDKNQVTALHEFGAKALWTQELEVGLLDGSLDMVVHSLKGEILLLLYLMLFSVVIGFILAFSYYKWWFFWVCVALWVKRGRRCSFIKSWLFKGYLITGEYWV